MFIVAADDDVPLNDHYTTKRGKNAIDSVVALMQSGRWVYKGVMSMPRVWGEIVPAAMTTRAWLTVTPRVQEAPMRIVYRDTILPDLLDPQIPRASAIYAGGDCSWSRFPLDKLTQTDLPHLQVLYLRPDIDDPRSWANSDNQPVAPADSPTPTIVAPRLRICESYYPLIVLGPVQRLACVLFTESQLLDVLRPLNALRRIDIAYIRGTEPIDLTSLIRETGGNSSGTTHLQFLRIRCGPARYLSLNTYQAPLDTPVLRTLDVGGPISLNAPQLVFARINNVHAREALVMIQSMASLVHLHLRWRLPLEPLHPDNGHTVRVERLQELYIASDLSHEALMFLSGLRAPNLRALHLICNMRGPADPDALPAIRTHITHSLHVAGEDADDLRVRLNEAQSSLLDAGYEDLAELLDNVVAPGLVDDWGEDADAGPDLTTLRGSAEEVVSGIQTRVHVPKQPHAGVLLRTVVGAALAIPDVPVSGECHLALHDDGHAIHMHAQVMKHAYDMRYTMPYVPAHGYGSNNHYSRPGDSPAFGAARMLFGLLPLRPCLLTLKGDPVAPHTLDNSDADMRMLRNVLRQYDSVEVLNFDFTSPSRMGTKFLRLLDDVSVLPQLRSLTVKVPDHHDLFEPFWGILEEVLTERDAALEVSIIGSFCVGEAYAMRLESAVNSLILKTRCAGPSDCTVCSWRA